MNERRRNIAVGTFVIVGMALLAGLILQFSQLVSMYKGGYTLTAHLAHAGAARKGKLVHYCGVDVGVVQSVELAEDGAGVVATLTIRRDVAIPGNAVLTQSRTGLGDAQLDIVLPREASGQRETPAAPLPTDGAGVLRTAEVTGPQLLPQSVTDKADAVLENLRALTEPRTPKDVRSGRAVPNVPSVLQHLDEALAGVRSLADEENQRNLKASLRSLAKASERISTALDGLEKTLGKADETFGKANFAVDKVSSSVDDVTGRADRVLEKLYDDAVRVANLLDTLNSLAKKVQEGEGTVGKLLTDDELHEATVLMAIQIRETLQDISRLVEKLEQEGLLRKGG